MKSKFYLFCAFFLLLFHLIQASDLMSQQIDNRRTAILRRFKLKLTTELYRDRMIKSIPCIMSSDASTIAIGNNIDRIIVWDINEKKQKVNFHNPYGYFSCPEFRLSPDGETLAVIENLDCFISQEMLDAFPEVYTKDAMAMEMKRFSIYSVKDGTLLTHVTSTPQAYTSTGRMVSLEEAANYEKLGGKTEFDEQVYVSELVTTKNELYESFEFSHDSDSLVTVLAGSLGYRSGLLGEKLNMKNSELETLYVCSDFEDVAPGTPVSHEVSALTLSGDGKCVAMVGGSDQLALFDLETGKVLCARQIRLEHRFTGLLTLNKDASLLAWQVSSPFEYKKERQIKRNHTRGVPYYTLRGCGVVLLNPQTGELIHEFLTPDPLMITSLAFSHDERYIAAGTLFGHVYLWDVKTGELARHFSVNNRTVKKTVVGFTEQDNDLVAVFIGDTAQNVLVQKWNLETSKRTASYYFSVPQ